MTDDPAEPSPSALVHESRLVFGAVLVDGTVRILECVDGEAFADGDAESRARNTAVVSVNADLVPLVVELSDPSDATPAANDPIVAFDRAAAAVADADTFYFVASVGDAAWKRARNAPGGFDDPPADACALADALVAESTARIGEFPAGTTKAEIDIVEWSS